MPLESWQWTFSLGNASTGKGNNGYPQQKITCSKSKIETPKKGVKYVQG